MKKRMIAFLLVLVLLLSGMSSALAAIDLSYVRSNPNLFTMDVNTSSDVAFIETTLTAKNVSFVHKYESATKYSGTRFDLLVINYSKSSTAYVIPRMWIHYSDDNQYLYFTSVTITLGGKDYTFSDISDSEWYTIEDKVYCQDMLIKFGTDNVDFVLAMLELSVEMEKQGSDYLNTVSIPMVLHGKEDIAVTLEGGFLLDFTAIINAFSKVDPDFDGLRKANATPVKVTTATK